METTTYTARILRPSQGHYLTQADESIDIADRVITDSEVWLAINADESDWIEIDAQKAQELKALQEAAIAEACEQVPPAEEQSE